MDDNVQVRFGAQTSDLDSDLNRLTSEFKDLFSSIENEVRTMSGVVQSEMRQVTASMDKVEKEGRSLGGMFGDLKGTIAGLAAGYGLTELARGVVNTMVEFERLRSVLKTLEGDAAGTRFADLKKFATETPYDLQQVVTAFTKLKARGLDPSNQALRDYGNVAAGMGRSLDQFVEAVGDAATGEMERLKEFGITAQQSGEKVTFMFKGVATTVGRDSDSIQKYLQKLSQDNFGDAMANQMDTLGGAFSNLGDAAMSIADDIGTGGLGAALNQVARDMTEATGESSNMASALGEGLGVAVQTVWQIVLGFGEAVQIIFAAVGDIISSVTGQADNDATSWGNMWRGVLVLINGFGVGVRVVFNSIGLIIRDTIDTFLAFGRVVARVMSFDFAGAVSTVENWASQVKRNAQDAGNNMVKAMQDGKARQDKILSEPPPKPKAVALPEYKAGTGGSFGKKAGGAGGGSDSKMGAWRDELQQRIQAENGYYKDSTQMEINFWNEKLKTVSAKSKEAQQIRNQLFQLEKTKAKESLDNEVQMLDDKQTAARDDLTTQLAIQDQKLAAIARTYGEDSQQYRNMLREKVRLQREFDQQIIQIEQDRISRVAQIAQIGAEAENAIFQSQMEERRSAVEDMADMGQVSPKERLVALGQILDEEVEMERQHEEIIYQIKVRSARDQIALLGEFTPERRKMLGELEVMEAEHNARMDEMRAAQTAKLRKFNRDVAKSSQQQWQTALAPIGAAFNGMLSNMLNGSMNFRNAFIGAMDQLFSQFLSNVTQMGVQWIATELAKTGATTGQSAIRLATEATTATTAAGISAAAGTAQVATNAAVGASGAFAATAPIPFVGPGLAPGVAAAAMAAIMGFGMLISARGGADIGSGVNPMAQLHEEEMVLPAHIANPLRTMLAGAGPRVSSLPGAAMDAGAGMRENTGSRGDTNFNYQPNHNNSDTDLGALLRRDGATFRKWMKNEMRNGAFRMDQTR